MEYRRIISASCVVVVRRAFPDVVLIARELDWTGSLPAASTVGEVVIHWFPLVSSVEGVSTWVVVVSWRVTKDSRLQSWCGPLNVPALSRGFFFSLFHGVLLHEGFLRSYRTIQDLLLKCIFLRNVLHLPLPRTRSPGARVSEAISSEFLPRWSICSHQGQHVTRPSKTDSL